MTSPDGSVIGDAPIPTLEGYEGPWEPGTFRDRVFIKTDFSGRCLVGADFRGAVCKDCDFSGSDLSNARFDDADLYRTDFRRAVLYAVSFDGANLTRTNFDGAFTYGWLLNSTANVAYARLLDFELEPRRRSVEFLDEEKTDADGDAATNGEESTAAGGDDPATPDEKPAAGGDTATIRFGDPIVPTAELSRNAYRVGSARFTFEELAKAEAALLRAQIYNRLKRLYRENHQGRAALHCQYHEHYCLTRSGYDAVDSPTTVGRRSRRSRFRLAFAYLAELTSGYGLRPFRVVTSLLVLWVAYFVMLTAIVTWSSSAGVIYEYTTVTRGAHHPTLVPGPQRLHGIHDAARLAQLATANIISPDPSYYSVYGWAIWLSLVYFAFAATLIALLFSTVFVRLTSE